MPAGVVLVLEEPGFADRTAVRLKKRGYDALALQDPMVALKVLEAASKVELLVTCEEFGPGKPTGLSLARMVRYKKPRTKVLFIGPATLAKHVEGTGELLASPVTEDQVVAKAIQMMGQSAAAE